MPKLRFSLIALSALLIVGIAKPASAAAIKAGATCSKLNQVKIVSNFAFTCLKSGKKLTWSKGVALKTLPAPSASPTTPAKPATPTIDQQVLQYLDEVKVELAAKYKNLKSDNLIPIADLIDSEAEESLAGKISAEGVQPARKFASLFLPNTIDEIMVVVGGNDVYIAGTVGDACSGVHDLFGDSCGDGFLYANVETVIDKLKITNDSVITKDQYKELTIWANVPHQMGHQIQAYLSVEKTGLDRFELYPSWLREGGSEVVKLMTYAIEKNISYHEAHSIFQAANKGSCANITLDDRAETYGDSCENTLGLYASEYLVWKFKDFKALFFPSENNADSVDATFKESYKLSVTEFVKEADVYINKIK